MKNLQILTLIAATSAVLSAPLKAEDTYQYIATPTPKQMDDLLDDDNDGVINARDLCPETPLSAEVDNDGCGSYVKTQEELSLHILFANDSADIQPAFLAQISEMARFLKTYPTTSIELQGYASKVGGAEHNLDLSKRRATAVKDSLIDNDIAPDRVRIVGFGDTNLSDTGTDEISHAKNRKVIATVVGHKGNFKEEWSIFTKIAK